MPAVYGGLRAGLRFSRHGQARAVYADCAVYRVYAVYTVYAVYRVYTVYTVYGFSPVGTAFGEKGP